MHRSSSELASALIASLMLGACGTEPSIDPADAARELDASVDDPEPSFTEDELRTLATLRYDPAPSSDPSNGVATSVQASRFGQRLFFDASLSGPLLDFDNTGPGATLGYRGETGRVSCASCHVPGSGFVDTRSPHRQVSLGTHWTRRRAPTLLEIGTATLYNWDGRRDTLWNQALGVMESSVELNSSRLYVAQRIYHSHRAEYEAIFESMPDLVASEIPQLSPEHAGCEPASGGDIICHGKPGDADYDALSPERQNEVTRVVVNAAKAIAAYQMQLRCGPSRFDAWLDGDTGALERAEQRGAALFVGRAGCVRCHSGPNLTDGRFHNVGMAPRVVATAIIDRDDRGAIVGIAEALRDPLNARGAFSDGDRGMLPAAIEPEMEGAFRTPTLRCISEQPSFMHTGQLRSLEDVVAFFDRGGDTVAFPGVSEIAPLELSARERADLAAFLRAIDGPGPDEVLLTAPD
jgi:cytochrome c peroxidase